MPFLPARTAALMTKALKRRAKRAKNLLSRAVLLAPANLPLQTRIGAYTRSGSSAGFVATLTTPDLNFALAFSTAILPHQNTTTLPPIYYPLPAGLLSPITCQDDVDTAWATF